MLALNYVTRVFHVFLIYLLLNQQNIQIIIDNEIIEKYLTLKTRLIWNHFVVQKVSKELYHNSSNHLTTRHKTFIAKKRNDNAKSS